MAKITDAQVAILKAFFETGDEPTQGQFYDLIEAIQEGVEEHDHEGLGDGDAAKVDHGAGLTGLGGDDHTQYLKEEASGGLASEVPDHTHADATEAGTVDHGALTGKGDDDHTQYLLADGSRLESVSPGHRQLLGAVAVAGGAITLIANGATDVTSILHAQATIKPSAGAATAGPVFIRNNSSTDLYEDGGTNTLTLTCNADGSLEVQRTAGSRTYDVILEAIWI